MTGLFYEARFGARAAGKITAVSVAGHGQAAPAASAAAGQIAKLRGLAGIQIGDAIGSPGRASGRRYFAPPSLETVVVPGCRDARAALHQALTQLAEQDPLINLRQEIYLSLYGEVQREVIGATLAQEFGLAVSFRETTTICIERPIGTGEAAEPLGQPGNPFLAGVGLRIEPGPAGSGVSFRLGIERGSLPVPFRKAAEETARDTLGQGLHGWQVADCALILTQSGYIPPQGRRGIAFDPRISSTAGDFRGLTPLVLMAALQQARTVVCEPIHRFSLEIPADTLAALLPVLAQRQAAAGAPQPRGSSFLLTGDIPAAQVHALQQRLPALTRGEGVLEAAFDRYRPVRGPAPERPRTDRNPLHRTEYLLHVKRRG